MILKKSLYFFLYFIIIILFFIIVINFFGIKTYLVVSESMQDEIKKGSISFVMDNDNFNKDNLKINDVVVCKNKDMTIPVMHKIIYLNDDSIITHGIMNEEGVNEEFTYDEIIAKHLFSIPYIGYLKNFISSFYFWLVFLLIIIGFYIVKKIIVELKRE